MKLEELSEINCEPPIVYVYNTEGKALLKTINTNIKHHDLVRTKEVVGLESNGVALYVTIKE